MNGELDGSVVNEQTLEVTLDAARHVYEGLREALIQRGSLERGALERQ